jgi:hypothetical protein
MPFKPVWVEARELKFGLNMLCQLKQKSACLILEMFEISFRISRRILIFLGKISKFVLVHLDSSLTMEILLCYLTHKTAWLNLEFFEIRLRVFLKNSKFFLVKCQKFVLVRLDRS